MTEEQRGRLEALGVDTIAPSVRGLDQLGARVVKEVAQVLEIPYTKKRDTIHEIMEVLAPKSKQQTGIEPMFKVTPDMSVEQMKAIFFDTDALQLPPIPLYRMDNGGKRYYYTYIDDKPHFFLSVTTFIKNSLPTSPYLIEWLQSMSKEEAQAYVQERADYGTLLHMLQAKFLIEKSYNLDSIEEDIEQYCKDIGRNPNKYVKLWMEDQKRDLLAFAQWCYDVNYRPIAIEIILCDIELGVAGAVDHVGYVTLREKGFFGEVYKTTTANNKKGDPKESYGEVEYLIIMDSKSGRKGFYEAHEVQLNAYAKMWAKNFPEKKVDKVFNWSPKSWRGKTPTYNFKDQSNSKLGEIMEDLVSIAKKKDDANLNDKSIEIVEGKLTLGQEPTNNVRIESMGTLIAEIRDKTPFESVGYNTPKEEVVAEPEKKPRKKRVTKSKKGA